MRRLLYIIMCLTCSMLARAQSYTYRYWFDDDFGNAKTTTGESVLKTDFDLTGLSESIHTLHLQVVDEKGVASSPQTQYFIKTFVSGKSALRYWFDDDYKSAKTVPVANFVHIDADVLGLSETIHRLSMQVVDENGVASLPVSKYFIKTSVSAESKLKYWFDDDSESGGEIAGNNIVTNIDVSMLTDGLHKLRTMVVGNAPSAVHNTYFLKTPQVLGVSSLQCVSYIDGKLYKQENVPADGSLLHYDLDASGVATGLHLLTVQIVTNTGAASSTSSSWFLRTNTTAELSSMKCFYSVDGENGMTQAGKFTDGTFHFDLDVANVSNGLHRLSYLLVTEDGQTTAMRNAFFMKTPLGGNGIAAYHYWLNTDYEGRKQVNLEKNVNPLNLMSLLPVESVPLRSSQFHFEWKDGKPMIYAQNDFHIRFYDAADRCVDQCKDFTDYSVSQEITDAELLLSGSPVVKNKPAENEIQWYHFPAAVGDSLSFKVDRACTVQVFAPSGKEVYNASGSDVVRWDGCHAWEDGEYYLALHDVTAQQGTNTKLEYQHIDKYAVLAHTPEKTGLAHSVLIANLLGNGFDKLYSAKLERDNVELFADTLISPSISTAQIFFELKDLEIPLGKYGLRLYFNDGVNKEEMFISDFIEIEEAFYGEIIADVITKNTSNVPYPITVKLKNTGNVPYQLVPIYIANTGADRVSDISFNNFYLNAYDDKNSETNSVGYLTDRIFSKDTHGYFLPLIIGQIDPYEEINLEFGYNAPRRYSFDFYAWTGIPWVNAAEISYARARMNAPMKAPCDVDLSDVANNIPTFNPRDWAERLGNMAQALGMLFGSISNASDAQVNRAVLDAYGVTPDLIGEDLYNGLRSGGKRYGVYSPQEIWDTYNGDGGLYAPERTNHKVRQRAGGCPLPNPHPIIIPGPVDPNDITGYTAESGSHFVKKDLVDVNYKIEFENDTAFATASAHVVVVKDTLDSKLFDLASFAPTSVKIGEKMVELDGTQNFVKTIDMRPEIYAIAQVEGSLDKQKGIATWTFTSLDPMTMEPTDDVMSGFLPINYDGRGQGEVTFDIKLRSGLADGTEIPNRASIVFDNEEAIMTPTWVNTIDAVAPTSRILDVNVVNDSTAIVDVEGFDERSGIWRYNLYVQQGEGSAWVLAAENVDTTAISVRVYDGISYGFCVLATDSAGNVEEKELHREYSIGTYLLGDANSDGVVDLQDAVLIVQYFVEAPDTYLNVLAADYNGDGNVDLQDAVAIVNKYVSSDTRNKPSRKRINKQILEQ